LVIVDRLFGLVADVELGEDGVGCVLSVCDREAGVEQRSRQPVAGGVGGHASSSVLLCRGNRGSSSVLKQPWHTPYLTYRSLTASPHSARHSRLARFSSA